MVHDRSTAGAMRLREGVVRRLAGAVPRRLGEVAELACQALLVRLGQRLTLLLKFTGSLPLTWRV